ncbi:MAG: MarR family winged helix-turn-helix transcriptional regulator [Myxococcota bacterium]|jgi:DNA-binding MarR family transcriptional regulator
MDSRSFHEVSGDLDARVAAALAKLALVGRYALGRRAAQSSLSAIQSLVLDRLARLGSAQVGELAAQLSVTPPTMSDSIAALERKGLLSRRAVAEDARRVEVHLTPRGRKVASSQADWPDVFQEALAALRPDEKAVVLRLLLRIIAGLVERGVIRDARMCVTCEHFRPDAHPGRAQPHHCALVDLPLSDEHLRVDCPDQVALTKDKLRARLHVLQGASR